MGTEHPLGGTTPAPAVPRAPQLVLCLAVLLELSSSGRDPRSSAGRESSSFGRVCCSSLQTHSTSSNNNRTAFLFIIENSSEERGLGSWGHHRAAALTLHHRAVCPCCPAGDLATLSSCMGKGTSLACFLWRNTLYLFIHLFVCLLQPLAKQ